MSDRKTPNTPPYLSYVTFKNTSQNLVLGGKLPRRIDRSVLGTMSGAGQKQFLAALKFFDLIDASGNPRERLGQLAHADESEWKDFMGVLLKERFPHEIEQLEDSSPKALRESFVTSFEGIGQSLIEPGIRFLVTAAKDCGFEVSVHISKRRARAANPPKRRQKRTARQEAIRETVQDGPNESSDSVLVALLGKFPDFDPAWPEQQQQAWFAAYQRLIGLHAEAGESKSRPEKKERSE